MQNDANCCDMSLYKVLFRVGWGGSCRGGVGHVGVGGSCRGGVGWVMYGGVGNARVGWVM